jgi:hypothetical protein
MPTFCEKAKKEKAVEIISKRNLFITIVLVERIISLIFLLKISSPLSVHQSSDLE